MDEGRLRSTNLVLHLDQMVCSKTQRTETSVYEIMPIVFTDPLRLIGSLTPMNIIRLHLDDRSPHVLLHRPSRPPLDIITSPLSPKFSCQIDILPLPLLAKSKDEMI